jgi:hypothetical protein
MKTLLIRDDAEPPAELRDIVRGGSTEVTEVNKAEAARVRDADRIVEWTGRDVLFEDRKLRWPDDADELRMLFETGG